MNKKVLIRLAVALVLLLFAVWSFTSVSRYNDLSDPVRARTKGLPMPVRTATIELKHFDELIGATGITEPSNSVAIRVDEGREFGEGGLILTEKYVVAGQRVTVGEVLFALDPETYELRVATEEAKLQYRTDDLRRREVDLKRFEELEQAGTLAVIEFTRFVAEAFEARFRRVEALESLHTARQILARTRLTSPIDGLVDRVEVVTGQVIFQREPLTTIHKIDPLHMRVDFPPERAQLLRAAKEMEMTVNVQLDTKPQQLLSAEVVHVGPVVDLQTRTLPVTVAIDNSDGMALPGVGGFARFRFKRSALLIPTVSVIERDSRVMVFTVEGETARIREIELGPTVEIGYREVLSGLSLGEKVVIFGQETLEDGDQVNEDWRDWARRAE